ncbi:MAG: hypothetical protein JSR89_12750 [Proteobacteria bacterium]|nr:hypothetical protein [Pseudomonadota bacterium]
MAVKESQTLVLRVLASSAVVLTLTATASRSSPVCVRCKGSDAAQLCVVDNSEKVESAPFGHILVERACLKALKSKGLGHCRVASDEACKNAPASHASLEEAKAALLEQAPSEPLKPTAPPSEPANPPPLKEAKTSSNGVSNAWMHIKSFLGWD